MRIIIGGVDMEVEITKMSKNGQVVIPAEIRREAHLKPSAKFLVFTADDTICLKRITKDELLEDLELIRRIEKSEKDFERKGIVKADTKMSENDIDDLLMGD